MAADAVVTFLLGNLGKLVVEQVNLISEALNEVKQVLEQVKILKAFLGDPAIQREEGFRVLAMEVREVVYAAQDITDSFLILELQAQLKPNIQYITFLPNHLERRLSLAKQLISFRKTKFTPMLHRVDHIKQFHMPNTHHRHAQQQVQSLPRMSPNKIVGFGDEAETLIKNVMEEIERLDVISITGMPGIGKTTLAWKIYQDEKIQQEFPTRIWINLPQGLDKNDLYLYIQKELNEQDRHYGLPAEQDRVDGPFKFLQDMKFLLVLENVWTVDDWNAIKDVLPMRNKRGKVLITSQNESVCILASRDDSYRKPLKLGLLSKQESWELLQLQVFDELNICPDWLQDIGKTVARNCDGLPHAIQILGRNLVVATSTDLAMELTLDWWTTVSYDVGKYVTEYKQQGALELSYNALPQEMRDCFLYLGVFPEDYEIPAWKLTRLWIAEGFIAEDDESLEKKAEQVLGDLIRSNLVIVVKLYYNGRAKTCRVHRVIHGFCKAKAREQNLFQEIKMSKEEDFDPPLSLTSNYRRLCIHSNLLEYLNQKPYGPGVRSLLCFQNESKVGDVVLETKHTSSIHKAFQFLKVFESKSSIKFAEFPIKLNRLMNLTYISLCLNYSLSVLPETISHLLNLQTLVVETESSVLEIKGNIWRMIKLRHLVTKAAISLPKQGEGKGGGELQTLTRLSPEYCTGDLFRRACDLKELGIRGELATLLATDTLGKLNRLRSLKLESTSLDDLTRLHPSCFPLRLTRLKLSGIYLDSEHMSILERMVSLRVLKLKSNAGMVDYWIVTDARGFPNLEFLFIGSTKLVYWEVSPHCFRSLRRLVLKNCEKLHKIPLSLAQSLETLELDNVSETAVESAMAIKEEKVRMQLRTRRWCITRKLNISIHPERT